MKRIRWIFIVILPLLLGCEDLLPQGPIGLEGAQGPEGAPGPGITIWVYVIAAEDVAYQVFRDYYVVEIVDVRFVEFGWVDVWRDIDGAKQRVLPYWDDFSFQWMWHPVYVGDTLSFVSIGDPTGVTLIFHGA